MIKLNKTFIFAALLTAVVLCVANATFASTVAYWTFDGPIGQGVTTDNGKTAYGTVGQLAYDSSGNGNTVSAWTYQGGCGFNYTNNVQGATVPQTGAPILSSVQNTGGWPSMETWSAGSIPTGTNIQTITPGAWTVEASIYRTTLGGHRTFVGRDGNALGNAAPLYFKTDTSNKLGIQYVDVGGVEHSAWDTSATVLNQWYNVAAVSDGTTLSLYKQIVGVDATYQLVGSSALVSSNTALTKVADDKSWSVGRGWYNGDTDRWAGYINQVRISDAALAPGQLLFSVPEPATFVMLSIAGVFGLLYTRLRKK